MAYLEAYAATGDAYYLDEARASARTRKGQYCSGGWDYLIEFDPARSARTTRYRADGGCAEAKPGRGDRPTTSTTTDPGGGARADAGRQGLGFKDARSTRRRCLRSTVSSGAVPHRRLAAALWQSPDLSKFPGEEGELPRRGRGSGPDRPTTRTTRSTTTPSPMRLT